MHLLVKFPIYFLSNAKIIFIRGGILLWVQHDCIKVGTDPLYNLGSGSAPAAASLDLRNPNVGAGRHFSGDSRTIQNPSLHLGNSSSRVNIFAIISLQERILCFTNGSQLLIQNLWISDLRKTISGVGAVELRARSLVWRSICVAKCVLGTVWCCCVCICIYTYILYIRSISCMVWLCIFSQLRHSNTGQIFGLLRILKALDVNRVTVWTWKSKFQQMFL